MAVLLLGAYAARAQEPLEQRYRRALDLFHKPDMEGACELLRQIDGESPGYKETRRYLNPACDAMRRLEAKEETLFREGVQSFNRGDVEGAGQKFQQARKIELKHPKHTREIDDYFAKIEERKFRRCVDAYDQQKFQPAEACFTQLLQADISRAPQARRYLEKIADALKVAGLLNDGIRLSKQGKYAEARAAFGQVARKGGPEAARARQLLAQLNEQARDQRSVPGLETTRKGAASSSESSAGEQRLRDGLEAYFKANFADAERFLTDYLDTGGSKRGLTYFFLGAAHSARYFLSGEKDVQQKAQALADFRTVKQHSGNFQPPEKYVSPKILALYTEAIHSAAPLVTGDPPGAP